MYHLRLCIMGNIACGCGLEANIALGFASCCISLSTALSNTSRSALTTVRLIVHIAMVGYSQFL